MDCSELARLTHNVCGDRYAIRLEVRQVLLFLGISMGDCV